MLYNYLAQNRSYDIQLSNFNFLNVLAFKGSLNWMGLTETKMSNTFDKEY